MRIVLNMRDVEKLRRQLLAKAKRVPMAMANEMHMTIKENSRAGRDIRGRKFKKYTPAYAKRRQKRGLSTKPDLRVTGDMLDRPSFKAGLLSPSIANQPKAEGNMKHRLFYPETESDIKKSTMKRLVRAGEQEMNL